MADFCCRNSWLGCGGQRTMRFVDMLLFVFLTDWPTVSRVLIFVPPVFARVCVLCVLKQCLSFEVSLCRIRADSRRLCVASHRLGTASRRRHSFYEGPRGRRSQTIVRRSADLLSFVSAANPVALSRLRSVSFLFYCYSIIWHLASSSSGSRHNMISVWLQAASAASCVDPTQNAVVA